MGREIRRVPPGWQHPKDKSGHYLALYDKTHEEALASYDNDRADWEADNDGVRSQVREYGYVDFDEWHEPPTSKKYCRSAFDTDPTHYQIYETVSEGTPTSPVFATLDEMVIWLIGEGYSDHAARKFVKDGWALSMIFMPERGLSDLNIHSLDWVNEESDQ